MLAGGYDPAAAAAWAPYLAALPRATGCVLEWPQALLDRFADTSAAADAASMRASGEAVWREAERALAAAPDGVAPAPDAVEPHFRWALSILLSRLVRLQTGPGGAAPGGVGRPQEGAGFEALVPWADFVNHSPAATSHLALRDGQVVLAADRPYYAGQQLYASYGARASSELLLSYGFVPPPGTNPADAYLLRLGVADGDPLAAAKEAALARYGLRAQETMPLRHKSWPRALLPYAAFVRITGEHLGGGAAGVDALAERLFLRGELPATPSGACTLQLAEELLTRALADAAAPLDATRRDDEGRVKRVFAAAAGAVQRTQLPRVAQPEVEVVPAPAPRPDEGGPSLAYLQAAVASVRVAEARLLQRTRRLLAQHIERLRAV